MNQTGQSTHAKQQQKTDTFIAKAIKLCRFVCHSEGIYSIQVCILCRDVSIFTKLDAVEHWHIYRKTYIPVSI